MNKVLIAFVGCVLGMWQNAHAQEPLPLLSKMCDAMNQTNYYGTLVYLHDNKLESMKISKTNNESGQAEKIYSLNGEAREIIRQNDTLMCIIPSAKKITIDSKKHAQLPFSIPHNLDNVQAYYNVSYQGSERVADKSAYVVQLTPKDSYRYGHRLWIDKQHSMLLKTDVLNERNQPIEQVMFTDLNIVEALPNSVFTPNEAASNYKRIDVTPKAMNEARTQILHWGLNKAPVGFAVVSHSRMGSANGAVEHLFLSDGMASVSVFIEPKTGEIFEGESRMGALNAYGAVKSGHKVVTVGAVPATTVKLINQNIVPVQ